MKAASLEYITKTVLTLILWGLFFITCLWYLAIRQQLHCSTSGSFPHSWKLRSWTFICVLLSDGIELIFQSAAHISGLYFGLRMRIMLITCWCFGCCSAVLTLLCWREEEQEARQEHSQCRWPGVAIGMFHTTEPRAHYITVGNWWGWDNHCWGTGWGQVSEWWLYWASLLCLGFYSSLFLALIFIVLLFLVLLLSLVLSYSILFQSLICYHLNPQDFLFPLWFSFPLEVRRQLCGAALLARAKPQQSSRRLLQTLPEFEHSPVKYQRETFTNSVFELDPSISLDLV